MTVAMLADADLLRYLAEVEKPAVSVGCPPAHAGPDRACSRVWIQVDLFRSLSRVHASQAARMRRSCV